MGPQSTSAVEDVLDNQILVLLQHQRRVTFLTLADSFPLYTWQSLFTALNRLRGQHHVELLPLLRTMKWYGGVDMSGRRCRQEG